MCALAEEPRTRPRQDLERDGRLDPVYRESGPRLKDVLDATLTRPTGSDTWDLDDYALPGGLLLSHLMELCILLMVHAHACQKHSVNNGECRPSLGLLATSASGCRWQEGTPNVHRP